jgi:hypothetical protein
LGPPLKLSRTFGTFVRNACKTRRCDRSFESHLRVVIASSSHLRVLREGATQKPQ